MSSHELVLAGEGCVARLVPHEGARVQSLIDSTTGREVLYRRHPQESSRKRFAACSTGGWDMLFPNDSAWRDFPDHGSVWSSSFTVERSDSASTVVRTELDRPAVEIVQSFTLLPRPRRGLNLSTTLRARSATSPFLLAYHPMLAIGEGWRIEGVGDDMTADDELPGRFGRPARRVGSDCRAGGAPACERPGRGDLCEPLWRGRRPITGRPQRYACQLGRGDAPISLDRRRPTEPRERSSAALRALYEPAIPPRRRHHRWNSMLASSSGMPDRLV